MTQERDPKVIEMASLKAFIMVAVGPGSPDILRVVGHGSENKNSIVHNSNYQKVAIF